jgi:hypothetical protein
MIPNSYDNWPPVGSTTEQQMQDGDWAALTADYLERREIWLKSMKEAYGS